MVQLASYSDKNRIMQFVYKLRNVEQKYKGVIIANDLTLAERETKATVAQAKIEEGQQGTPG